MTVDEAIEARYARFDRMYQKAVGHTFREDPQWCAEQTAKEMAEWQPKMDAFLKEKGFNSENDYWNYILDSDKENDDPEFRKLYSEKPEYDSLYPYEESCVNQAKAIVDFLFTINEDLKEAWKQTTENSTTVSSFINHLKKLGFTQWDDGHSGNSAEQSVLFAQALCIKPEYFPYLHGALAPLVGDRGYHDTRDDLPEKL